MAKRKVIPNTGSGTNYVDFDLGKGNPKQCAFWNSPKLYTAYGGARGGGKTHAVRIKAVGGCVRYPGLKVLIIRRTYPELEGNHIDPIKKLVPQTIASYNGTLHQMSFINGSTIKFGHYNGASSEGEYQGQEYDWIFMDEATHFTYHEFRFLGGLLRGVNDIPKRFYLTCNPGGVGHRWVKRLFVDREFITDDPDPDRNENPDDYAPLIFATVEDNTELMKSSPGYISMLNALPENIRRAHRYGDWNALSGSYFPEFSKAVHIVEPFKIPAHWTRYRAFDYGLDMFAVGWFAVDEAGRCYMYRELKRSGLIVTEAAQMLHDMTLPDEKIVITFAPPDMWARQKDTGKTMAELFMLSGIPVVKADNNRIQGWYQIKEALADMGDGKPGLLFFKNQTNEMQDDLEAIQADDKNPNDCAKEPHDITHICDMLRYFCVSRTMRPEQFTRRVDEWDDDEDDEDYDDFMTGGAASSAYITYGGRTK